MINTCFTVNGHRLTEVSEDAQLYAQMYKCLIGRIQMFLHQDLQSYTWFSESNGLKD